MIQKKIRKKIEKKIGKKIGKTDRGKKGCVLWLKDEVWVERDLDSKNIQA